MAPSWIALSSVHVITTQRADDTNNTRRLCSCLHVIRVGSVRQVAGCCLRSDDNSSECDKTVCWGSLMNLPSTTRTCNKVLRIPKADIPHAKTTRRTTINTVLQYICKDRSRLKIRLPHHACCTSASLYMPYLLSSWALAIGYSIGDTDYFMRLQRENISTTQSVPKQDGTSEKMASTPAAWKAIGAAVQVLLVVWMLNCLLQPLL